MNLKNKKVLVMGIGISGISTIKALDGLGAKIIINDIKDEQELESLLNKLDNISFEKQLGKADLDLEGMDLIIKSPGIRPDNKILVKAKEQKIKIINDIELGASISKSKNLIAITGTNGKTTTTTILGEILKKNNYNLSIGGNIGKSILNDMIKAKKEDVFLLETSSFQLENIVNFKPKISLILNITEDHLDWHGSFENYVKAKKKIFKNQDKDDYTVLNYDDKLLRSFKDEINSNIIWFSLDSKLDRGIFIDDGDIIINLDGKKINFISIDNLLLKGNHNLENILASIAISLLMKVSLDNIRDTILGFKGVEHRLEFVREKNGRSFYNDSKGTNINSTLKAIDAIEEPIILIAGGYDKKIEFDELIQGFNGKIKTIILMGETSNIIEKTALKNNFNEIILVDDMNEAVTVSYDLSKEGDNILLSPACASWGMFKDFEERGRVFKEVVLSLGKE